MSAILCFSSGVAYKMNSPTLSQGILHSRNIST
jgi:hypothetical protein